MKKEINGIDITQHIPYVRTVARSIVNTYGIYEYYEDLVSDGIIGLIEAAKRFDHTKDNKFLSYAVHWIKCIIFRNLPKYISHISYSKLNVNIDTNIKYNKLNTHNIIYLNQAVKEDEIDATFEEIFIPPDYDPTEIENKIFMDEVREKLIKIIDEVLDEREKNIVKYRIGLEDGESKTLAEVGEILNISRERVRQLEVRALRKIRRKILKDEKLRDLKYLVNEM